ncbi:hypothetical protein [Streptomyces chumphonensis]|uniref:hypothetical protein n=1 Tax=Streptomyces chumphonensis TaxID=1214925 RepID=UPI003D756D82
MEERFWLSGTAEVPLLGIPDEAWSVRVCGGTTGGGEPMLLLALPHGLFTAQDVAMAALGARPGPVVARDDVRFLTEAWGFTAAGTDEDVLEIADTALVRPWVSGSGVTVTVAGVPWLVRGTPVPGADAWGSAACGEEGGLLGVCFDLDLDAPDAEDRFFSAFLDHEAVLGHVCVDSVRV